MKAWCKVGSEEKSSSRAVQAVAEVGSTKAVESLNAMPSLPTPVCDLFVFNASSTISPMISVSSLAAWVWVFPVSGTTDFGFITLPVAVAVLAEVPASFWFCLLLLLLRVGAACFAPCSAPFTLPMPLPPEAAGPGEAPLPPPSALPLRGDEEDGDGWCGASEEVGAGAEEEGAVEEAGPPAAAEEPLGLFGMAWPGARNVKCENPSTQQTLVLSLGAAVHGGWGSVPVLTRNKHGPT